MTATSGILSRLFPTHWDKPHWVGVLINGIKVLLILGICLPAEASADSKVDEYDLKAVYLYNFSKFISWPEERFSSDDDTFNICINGPLPSSSIITQLLKRTTQGRALHIQPLQNNDTLDVCHIVYFRDGDPEDVEPTLTSLKQKSILTVGDYQGFATSGGVVEFAVNKNNKLELIINLGRAKADGIEISAQLLEIAAVVHKEGRK